jgi:nucleotide-binding universal stress UspA family protein
MTIRTIEVPCYCGLDLLHQLDAALALAEPLGSHIEVSYVRLSTMPGLATLPPASLAIDPLALPVLERAAEEDGKRQKDVFELWCQEHGIGHKAVQHRLDSVFATWSECDGPLGAEVLQRGRLADLTVVKRPDAGDPSSGICFDAAVFETGRPTLVVSDRVPHPLLRHVVVAWSGSREVTRALAQTMPMLHAAETVSVFSAAEDGAELPGSELAAALRWQGIEARRIDHRGPPASVGGALIDAAAEQDASLIIMGAYTHGRLRQLLLGGVTRDVLHKCPIPVVMAH